MRFRWLSVVVGLAAALPAQDLFVRSELQRVGSDGKVIAQDRMERPREILSPALARNGFASYFLTANIPPGTEYILEVGQNPENAVRIVLYRQHYNPNGVPDRLEKVDLPVQGRTITEEHQTFWMDVWVDANTPVQRIKLEAQLWVGSRWVLYPMEARIVNTRIPQFQPKFWGLPAPEARADVGVVSPWRDYLCRPLNAEFQPKETTIRVLQQRNFQQDVTLARMLGRDVTIQAFVRGGLAPENAVPDNWCNLPVDQWRSSLSTEWYLKVRDYLYRQ